MCLILFAYRHSPGQALVVAANRDEFYRRPTRTMQFWPEQPQLLAGQDLREGGTWLGITRNGRFAAVTNYREPPRAGGHPRSRGRLTLDHLLADLPTPEWLASVAGEADQYGGFNLIAGDETGLWYLGNRGGECTPRRLEPGLYGLSNELLDSPWMKVVEGKAALAQACGNGGDHEELIGLLRDRRRAGDEQLPATGMGVKLERMLSPRFIRSPWYGTRASTALTIAEDGEVLVTEQNYMYLGMRRSRRQFRFRLAESRRW